MVGFLSPRVADRTAFISDSVCFAIGEVFCFGDKLIAGELGDEVELVALACDRASEVHCSSFLIGGR